MAVVSTYSIKRHTLYLKILFFDIPIPKRISLEGRFHGQSAAAFLLLDKDDSLLTAGWSNGTEAAASRQRWQFEKYVVLYRIINIWLA